MQSSPYLPSSMPNQESTPEHIDYTAITLAREEDLKGMPHKISEPQTA